MTYSLTLNSRETFNTNSFNEVKELVYANGSDWSLNYKENGRALHCGGEGMNAVAVFAEVAEYNRLGR